MTFYAESYFEQQQQLESMINYAIMVLLLILIVFNVSHYLRHRLHSRTRDLGIIFFLLLLIFTGLVKPMARPITRRPMHSTTSTPRHYKCGPSSKPLLRITACELHKSLLIQQYSRTESWFASGVAITGSI